MGPKFKTKNGVTLSPSPFAGGEAHKSNISFLLFPLHPNPKGGTKPQRAPTPTGFGSPFQRLPPYMGAKTKTCQASAAFILSHSQRTCLVWMGSPFARTPTHFWGGRGTKANNSRQPSGSAAQQANARAPRELLRHRAAQGLNLLPYLGVRKKKKNAHKRKGGGSGEGGVNKDE